MLINNAKLKINKLCCQNNMFPLNPSEFFHILQLIWLSIALTAFLLSLWIIIPAPNLFFIPLSVGIPEISPWLIIIQAISLIIALINFQANLFFKILLFANLTGLVLALMPVIQFPQVSARFQQEVEAKLGQDYLKYIPDARQAQMRPKPLILKDLFLGIPQPEVRIDRAIAFAQLDEVTLTLNVYKPLSVGKHPTIVVIYGGAWQNGTPEKNENFSLYMASQNYTVIAIDYRHAPKYRFPTQLNDVQLALQYIKDNALELEVDLDKMVIMGRSAGGQLAALTGYDNDIIAFKAVVDYYGPINLTHAYRNLPIPDPIDTRTILEEYLGDNPDKLPELYKQASPINYVQPNLPPTLLIYAHRDHIVQPTAGAKMAHKLTQAGNCAIFLEIDWADHAFDTVFFGLSNQLALYYTERFLASVLETVRKVL